MVKIPHAEHLGEGKGKVLWKLWSIWWARENHYTWSWLVCCVLCSLPRWQGAEERRNSWAHPLPLAIRSFSVDLHGLTGKYRRIQGKFRKCHYPWSIWSTETFDFRRWVVVSDPFRWIPFCGENLSVLIEPCQICKVKGKFKSNPIRWTKLIQRLKLSLWPFLHFCFWFKAKKKKKSQGNKQQKQPKRIMSLVPLRYKAEFEVIPFWWTYKIKDQR